MKTTPATQLLIRISDYAECARRWAKAMLQQLSEHGRSAVRIQLRACVAAWRAGCECWALCNAPMISAAA